MTYMKNARGRFGAFCVLLTIVLTTMLYASQSANTPLVQIAFADTLRFGQTEVEQPTFEGKTLGSMVEGHVGGVMHEASVEALISVAEDQLGKGYARGGIGPNVFDCSGLVMYCAREAWGIDLPHNSVTQAAYGTEVSMDQLERGDLLFWGSRRSAYHVGIYLGNGEYIHAAGRGQGICRSSFDCYAPTFARRLI